MVKLFIPNLISLCNLLCGCLAILLATENRLEAAALLMVLGIFLDFFDGMAARLLNAKSDLGLQLDSLADVVTSGVAPAVIMVQLLHRALNGVADGTGYQLVADNLLPLLGLVIAAASAYRLANFNIDTRQTDSFIGLPTPANAILIGSLPLILEFQTSPYVTEIILNPWVLGGLTLLSGYLLNANIALFSLKFKTRAFKSNKLRYVFLLLSLVLLALLWFKAIPVIILFYVILSVIAHPSQSKVSV